MPRGADRLNCLIRVVDARQLCDNAGVALALHDRFRNTEAVDPVLDNRLGRVHGTGRYFLAFHQVSLQHHLGATLQVEAKFDAHRVVGSTGLLGASQPVWVGQRQHNV